MESRFCLEALRFLLFTRQRVNLIVPECVDMLNEKLSLAYDREKKYMHELGVFFAFFMGFFFLCF